MCTSLLELHLNPSTALSRDHLRHRERCNSSQAQLDFICKAAKSVCWVGFFTINTLVEPRNASRGWRSNHRAGTSTDRNLVTLFPALLLTSHKGGRPIPRGRPGQRSAAQPPATASYTNQYRTAPLLPSQTPWIGASSSAPPRTAPYRLLLCQVCFQVYQCWEEESEQWWCCAQTFWSTRCSQKRK